jgi:hypothetical protein
MASIVLARLPIYVKWANEALVDGTSKATRSAGYDLPIRRLPVGRVVVIDKEKPGTPMSGVHTESSRSR